MLNDTQKIISSYIESSLLTKKKWLENASEMSKLHDVCLKSLDAYRNGKKLLIAGNGGSAADAQHIAAELVGRFAYDRPALPSIALTTDTSILTAVGNDYGYDEIFARQVSAMGNAGDVFLAITTSGNSKNILLAVEAAKKKQIIVVGMTGETGGLLREQADICLQIPSTVTSHIQECHIVAGHLICGFIESQLFPR